MRQTRPVQVGPRSPQTTYPLSFLLAQSARSVTPRPIARQHQGARRVQAELCRQPRDRAGRRTTDHGAERGGLLISIWSLCKLIFPRENSRAEQSRLVKISERMMRTTKMRIACRPWLLPPEERPDQVGRGRPFSAREAGASARRGISGPSRAPQWGRPVPLRQS